MAHLRAQILAQFRSALSNAGSGLGLTILRGSSRVDPIPPGSATIVIYPLSEAADAQGLKTPRTMLRQLTVAVECVRRYPAENPESAPMDVQLDALCTAVEQAMWSHWNTAGAASMPTLADTLDLVSTTFSFSGDGNAPIASARLEYLVTYRVRQDAIETSVL